MRKTIKWGGAVVAVVLLAAWGASERVWINRVTTGWTCALVRGGVAVLHLVDPSHQMSSGWYWDSQAFVNQRRLWWVRWGGDAATGIRDAGPASIYASQRFAQVTNVGVAVPFWPLAGVGITVSAVAWGMDRRAKRRERALRCPACNYLLAGLASTAVCPECGTARVTGTIAKTCLAGVAPHTLIRATVKWAGAIAAVVLLAMWGASERWCVNRETANWTFSLNRGSVIVIRHDGPSFRAPPGWYAVRYDASPAIRVWWLNAWDSSGGTRVLPFTGMLVPLWMPASLTLLATLGAWRLDARARHRARAGRCAQCNYDRAGLAPGAACPECGAFRRARQSARNPRALAMSARAIVDADRSAPRASPSAPQRRAGPQRKTAGLVARGA